MILMIEKQNNEWKLFRLKLSNLKKFHTFLRVFIPITIIMFTDKESLLYHSMQPHLNAFLFRLNAFLANVPILYPLETPENLWFSGIFRE